MLFINHLNKDSWWEFDKEKLMAFNYRGGHNYVDENSLSKAEIFECESWHDLYLQKKFCPIEEDKWAHDVWISPEGKFYDGDAHEVAATYLLDIIYGVNIEDIDYGGDMLEARGWVRATTSFMWEIRFDEWKDKIITQKQYGALSLWCECHNKKFPKGVRIKRGEKYGF